MSSYMSSLHEQELWEKFYELSQEMAKFLRQNDTDMFLEMLRQRNVFEEQLDTIADKVYIKTAAGQELLHKIVSLNKTLIEQGEGWLNKSRRGFGISQQYELLGFDTRGSRLDGRC